MRNSKAKKRPFTNITTDRDWSSYTIVYFVKAPTKEAAFDIVMDHGFYPEGKEVYSDYDCSGQHFCRPIHMRDVSWSKSRKCYMLEHRWSIDI